ncbi:DEAD/DEAH box helicase [Kribbella sp. NPDC048928]|uniref:DEAD/DEAH box helicase n=1 Tax=Kribbella sp. NPDC048928 TaxID=3364111 RepID=UPI0037185E16
MAEYLTTEQVRDRLQDPEPFDLDGFDLLRFIAHSIDPEAQEQSGDLLDLVIRVLERRQEFEPLDALIEAITRQVGLYPYLYPERLAVADQLAFEAHRPRHMSDLVFHSAQGKLYRRLLAGENLILSAPTSFGKSLIVDALLSSDNYTNVAIVVPTIALIDETRRRLSRFRARFKLITHPSQRPDSSNIYVMTQERILDLQEIPAELELFVIDEFYKLDTRRDNERSGLLNSALGRLLKTDAQFLFIGPSIESVTESLPADFNASFVHTDFKTVAADVVQYPTPTRKEERGQLTPVIEGLEGATLIYCRSPNRTRQVATWINEDLRLDADPELEFVASWLGENFHPEWYVVEAIRHRIGVHHGQLPRSIAQWMVRAFNDGRLTHLVCTSTLIEGVNTRAKNVVIFDRTIAMQAYDFFTFNNIRGRSGRMFHHFVGKVILFHQPPAPELPIVDIPVLSQSENADDALLLQLDSTDLTSESRDRLAPYMDQDDLSVETMRENTGIDPERQLQLARRLLNDRLLSQTLAWNGYPTYEQLVTVCTLIVQVLRQQRGMSAGVASGRQLAFLLNRLSQQAGDVRNIIDQRLSDGEEIDNAVENSLDFIRYWPGHNFPRYLMTIDRIQKEILPRLGMIPGDYRFYASTVENLFLPPPLQTLEEYGVPIQLAVKLQNLLVPDNDIDALLERLASLEIGELELHPFEKEMLSDAQQFL